MARTFGEIINGRLAETFCDILKFNPYHDRLGRFSSSSGSGSFSYSQGKANNISIERDKEKHSMDKKYTVQFGYGTNTREYETDKTTHDFFEKQKAIAGFLITADRKKDILGDVKSFYSQYQKGTANENNFYVNTIAEFTETKRPRRKPDYVSFTRDGKVSSEYWYSEDGVIRGSKHWGNDVASCDWYIENQTRNMNGYKQYGKCNWGDFTQKTQIVTHKNKATISTFENTIGGQRKGHGIVAPLVEGFID